MRRRRLVALVGITALSLGLRLFRLDADSFWHDEFLTWTNIEAPWSQLVPHVIKAEFIPPLYFAVLKIWSGIAGDGEFALRVPSVFFGTWTVFLLGRFVWRLAGPAAGCLASLLLAISPFHVYYSQEARPYALFALLILSTTMVLGRALEKQAKPAWNVYVALASLACYTHYFTVYFLAAQSLVVALFCIRQQKWRLGLSWVIAMAKVGFLYTPWIPCIFQHVWRNGDWLGTWLGTMYPLQQLETVGRTVLLHYYYGLLSDAFLLGVVLAIAAGLLLGFSKSTPGNEAWAFRLLVAMVLGPLMLAWLVSQFRPSLYPRYVIPILPPAMGMIAVSSWAWRRFGLRYAVGGFFACCLTVALADQMSHQHRPDMRGLAEHLAKNLQPGDGVYLEPWWEIHGLNYYMRDQAPPMVNYYVDASNKPGEVLDKRIARFKRIWHVKVYADPYGVEHMLDQRFSFQIVEPRYWRISIKIYTVSDAVNRSAK